MRIARTLESGWLVVDLAVATRAAVEIARAECPTAFFAVVQGSRADDDGTVDGRGEEPSREMKRHG